MLDASCDMATGKGTHSHSVVLCEQDKKKVQETGIFCHFSVQHALPGGLGLILVCVILVWEHSFMCFGVGQLRWSEGQNTFLCY